MSAGATAPLSFAQTVSARCQRVISRRRFFKEAKAKTTEEEEREEDLEAKHEHLAAAGDTAWASSFPPPLPSVPPYSDEGPARPSHCSWWCVPACGPTDAKSESLDWTCGGAGCGDAECPPVEMETDIFNSWEDAATPIGDGDSESKACLDDEAALQRHFPAWHCRAKSKRPPPAKKKPFVPSFVDGHIFHAPAREAVFVTVEL